MPRCWARPCAGWFVGLVMAGPVALAEIPALDDAEALRISQRAIGTPVGNHAFVDSRGNHVTLASLRGRPAVVSLIYTSCYHTCPLITRRLAEAVTVARGALGDQAFSVLTIGFDAPTDSPQRMAAYARERRLDGAGWQFLSADQATVAALARDLGFVFFPSPRGFDHLAQVSVIDANGRLYRQIYGDDFAPPALVEPLRELALGVAADAGVSHWLERVRLFCTVYDAASGRYRFDYSIVVAGLTGLLCLGAVGTFIVRAWRASDAAARGAPKPRDAAP